MTKTEFFEKLRAALSGLPQNDIEERIAFYTEMIEDRIEEGIAEETAVAEIGDIDQIAAQAIAETPLSKLVKEKITPKKRMGAFTIILLILGSPIWLSLIIVAFAVVFSIYVSLWSLIIALWATFAAIVCCALCSIVGIFFMFSGNFLTGLAVVGCGIACAGLSVFMYFVCLALTKGIIRLTRKFAIWLKRRFVKKEAK